MTPRRRPPAEWCTPDLERRLDEAAPGLAAPLLLLPESASSVAAVPAAVPGAAAWSRHRLPCRRRTP